MCFEVMLKIWILTILEPIMYLTRYELDNEFWIYWRWGVTYCTSTTKVQRARVPFWPKLLKNICAIGCPIGLSSKPFISVPMQKASDMFIAKYEWVHSKLATSIIVSWTTYPNPRRLRCQWRWQLPKEQPSRHWKPLPRYAHYSQIHRLSTEAQGSSVWRHIHWSTHPL